eukprot:tig00021282_g19947.t1
MLIAKPPVGNSSASLDLMAITDDSPAPVLTTTSVNATAAWIDVSTPPLISEVVVSGFRIFRSLNPVSGWQEAATLSEANGGITPQTITYIDVDLSPQTDYYYKALYFTPAASKESSEPKQARTGPPAPELAPNAAEAYAVMFDLIQTGLRTDLILATKLYRNGTLSQTPFGAAASFVDDSVSPGITYEYTAQYEGSVYYNGASTLSDSAFAVPLYVTTKLVQKPSISANKITATTVEVCVTYPADSSHQAILTTELSIVAHILFTGAITKTNPNQDCKTLVGLEPATTSNITAYYATTGANSPTSDVLQVTQASPAAPSLSVSFDPAFPSATVVMVRAVFPSQPKDPIQQTSPAEDLLPVVTHVELYRDGDLVESRVANMIDSSYVFTDSGLPPGTTFTYEAALLTAYAKSDNGSVAATTVLAAAPMLTASGINMNASAVAVKVAKPLPEQDAAVSIRIYFATSIAGPYSKLAEIDKSADVYEYTHMGLESGTQYWYMADYTTAGLPNFRAGADSPNSTEDSAWTSPNPPVLNLASSVAVPPSETSTVIHVAPLTADTDISQLVLARADSGYTCIETSWSGTAGTADCTDGNGLLATTYTYNAYYVGQEGMQSVHVSISVTTPPINPVVVIGPYPATTTTTSIEIELPLGYAASNGTELYRNGSLAATLSTSCGECSNINVDCCMRYNDTGLAAGSGYSYSALLTVDNGNVRVASPMSLYTELWTAALRRQMLSTSADFTEIKSSVGASSHLDPTSTSKSLLMILQAGLLLPAPQLALDSDVCTPVESSTVRFTASGFSSSVQVTSVELFRDGVLVATAPSSSSRIADATAAPSRRYVYSVRLAGPQGVVSSLSAPLSVSTPPSAPTLSLSSRTRNSTSIRIARPPDVDDTSIVSLKLYLVRSLHGTGASDASASDQPILVPLQAWPAEGVVWTDVGLQSSVTYQYRGFITNADGWSSPFSNEISAETLSLALEASAAKLNSVYVLNLRTPLLIKFTSPAAGAVVGRGQELFVRYSSASTSASDAELLFVAAASSTSTLLLSGQSISTGGGLFRVSIPAAADPGDFFIRVRSASLSSSADTPTFRVTAVETRVETVEYDPDAVPSLADRIRSAPGYASIDLSVVAVETAASGGGSARSRLQAATVTHTFALPAPASSMITFLSLMQTLTHGDALLSGIYYVESGLSARANLAYVFSGLPLSEPVTAKLAFDPDIAGSFADLAKQIQRLTGYRPKQTIAKRRSMLQYSEESVASFVSKGALLPSVYSVEFEHNGAKTSARHPLLSKSASMSLPYAGITLAAGSGAADLSLGSSSSSSASFELLSAEGASGSTGVAAARSAASGGVTLFAAAPNSGGLDAPIASVPIENPAATVQCAVSDGSGGLFLAFDPPNGGSSLVRYLHSTQQTSTLPASSLPQPFVCVRLGPSSSQPLRLLVGSRAPGLYVVSVQASGALEAKAVALPGTSGKPIALASRAPLSRAAAAVFLQSDDAASATGGECNSGDGGSDAALHIVDGSGGIASVPAKLRGVCPRALAVSPDSSFAVILSTDGRLFRGSLRSRDGAAFSELKGSGPDGAPQESTLLSVGDALPTVAAAAAAATSVALEAAPELPAVYVAFGRYMARFRVAPASVQVLGPGGGELTMRIRAPLSIPYVTGGLVSGVEIKILNPMNLRTIHSFVSALPAGLTNSRRVARIPLTPPTFGIGGHYAVQACVLDEADASGCSEIPSSSYFAIQSPDGSAAAEPKVVLFSVRAPDGSVIAVGKLLAAVDGVAVEPPQRGSVESDISAVDATRVPAAYDSVLEASVSWNGAGKKGGLVSGPGRGLHLLFTRAPASGRWLLVNATVLDSSGEGVWWVPGLADAASPAFAASAALGEEIACSRLRVPLFSGSPAVERGWLELQDFRLAAFASAGAKMQARSYGCGGTESCQLQQSSAAGAALAASCAPAEPTSVEVRADLDSNGVDAIVQQASAAAGTAVTVSQSRRRLRQAASTLSLSLGAGPTAGAAAVSLVDAVNGGSSSVSLLQGVAVSGSEEITNPAAPAPGQWTAVASAPMQFEHACAFGAAIYFVNSGTSLPAISVSGFDPATGAWNSGVSLPDGGSSASLACTGPVIYAFGGILGGAPTSLLRSYSTADGAWTTIAPASGSAPPPRSSAALLSISDTHLLLAGGVGGGSAALSDVWLFDVATSEWAQLDAPASGPSPLARYGAAAASAGDAAYIFGGASQAGADATFYNALYSFAVDTASSSSPAATLVSDPAASPSAPSPRAFALMQLSSTGTSSRIYITGGFESSGQPSNPSDLFIFDIGAAVWAKVAPTGAGPSGLARSGVAAYGSALYFSAAAGVFAWSVDGVDSFASASQMVGAASVMPEVVYPVSTSVILLGGSSSASWVAPSTAYTSVVVTAFPVDRSRVIPVYSGVNVGTCRMTFPANLDAGSYRVQVVLSGPTVPVPLRLLSDAFTTVTPEDVLSALEEAVVVLAPTTTGDVILGEQLSVAWATMGLPPEQSVSLSLVDTSTDAEFAIASLSTSTAQGFAKWQAEGIPPGSYALRISVEAANKTYSATSAGIALKRELKL